MKPLEYILENKEYHFDPEKEFKNRSIGIVCASRGNLTDQQNYERESELLKTLKSRGHNVIPAEGGYTENYGAPTARDVKEHSFIVMHKTTGDDHGKIFGDLKELGEKYGQDSILHKPYNSDVASLHGTNDSEFPGRGKKSPCGRLKMEKGEFYTKLRDGRHFSFKQDKVNEAVSFADRRKYVQWQKELYADKVKSALKREAEAKKAKGEK